jgi:hypothetical protein
MNEEAVREVLIALASCLQRILREHPEMAPEARQALAGMVVQLMRL